ncbi:MAG TPA: hypothetical protein VHZ25_06470 [Acidobacteriaceae bacterium]|jgi:hypothetical protein|nr:hypothetical protein [Acidobacteriaceae bacterium]
MFRKLFVLAVFLASPALHASAPEEGVPWETKVAQALPLLGHRNWILIVDSAYPLQASPGVETIETNAPLVAVLRFTLNAMENSEHVRPDLFMDAELPFVTDQDAPGASQYRANIGDILRGYPVQTMPHSKLIGTVDSDSKTFQVLVLKTNMTIPYSSVFIRLNCKYWSDEAEARLRAKMGPQ